MARCWALLLTLGLLSSYQLNATTCVDATVISALPYTGATTCGGNDITSSNVTVCSPVSTLYFGGNEALFTFTPTADMTVNVAYTGQTYTQISVYAGCPTSGGACVTGISSSSSSKDVTAALAGGTQYYILIDTWPSPPSACPGTLTVTEIAPPSCDGATAIGSLPFSGALTCGGNVITASNTSCSSVSTLYFGGNEALFYLTPASDMVLDIAYSGQTYTQISVYEGCPLNAGGCVAGVSSSTSSKNLTAAVTAGTEYYILVDTWPSPDSPCPGTLSVAEFVPPPGDDCADAQDLASLTSPYSGTTVGYTNDYGTDAFACPSLAVDRVFYIDVPPAGTLTIGQTVNAYDSRHRVAYGGACPGATEIACVDDPDVGDVVWINTTGAMQRVYWLQDGYTTSSAGTFTLAWDLVVPPPVPNDNCSGAEAISCGETVSGTTIGASIDELNNCGTSITAPGVWYTFTAGSDSRFYSLSTCDQADFDTKISVFTGSCDRLICLGGTDDSDNCDGGTTELIFTPAYGRVHYVLVHGSGSEIGDFDLTLDCAADPFPEDPGPGPANNDDCAGAISVSCGQTVTGTTVGFTDSNPGTCGVGGDGNSPGVWYTITGTGDLITASLCGSGFDTQIAVYSGSCGALSCVAGNDDFCGLQSSVSWPSAAGTEYYIYIDGFGAASGSYTMSVTCSTPSGNDLCGDAIPVSCGQTVNGSTIGASFDNVGTCVTSNSAAGVWYSFAGDGSAVTVSTCGSGYDTKLSVFSGSCGALSCVTGNDDACGLQSTVNFATSNGTTYYILVHGFGTAVGNFTMSVTCVAPPPPPTNDACGDAIELSCNTTVTGSTAQAAPDTAPTCDGASVTAPGVWYTFTGSSRIVNLNTCGSSYDTKLSVYTGSCTDGLVCVAGNDDFCGLQSSVTFVPQQGVQYYVLVHGFGSGTGNFSLEYDCQSPLPRTQNGNTIAEDVAISLFPNPAQDVLNVQLEGMTGDQAMVLIHNSLGQLMMERRIQQVETSFERFNISQLQSGMYFLTVQVEGKGKFTKKFMVGSVRP